MKITRFLVYPFRLPLAGPLAIGKETIKERRGLIVELGNEQGHLALGETSPLTGFSQETLQQAKDQLAGLAESVLEEEIPEALEALSGGFEVWLGGYHLAPSVRFGFETAVLGLLATVKGVPLPAMLCEKPSPVVTVNGLLSGAPAAVLKKAKRLLAQGYMAFKLKVGRLSLDRDVAMVRALRDLMGDHILLRLDANRAWSVEQALAFAGGLSDMAIDYMEEPVGSFDLLVRLSKDPAMTLSLALDESLLKMEPADLLSLSGIKAVVLKPTLLGFEKTMQFARTAWEVGMTPVVSSAFESGVGLTVLAQIASSLNQGDIPAGLDTLDRFVVDLLESPLRIQNGSLEVFPLPGAVEALKKHPFAVAAHG